MNGTGRYHIKRSKPEEGQIWDDITHIGIWNNWMRECNDLKKRLLDYTWVQSIERVKGKK